MLYISNAFALSMLPTSTPTSLLMVPVTAREAAEYVRDAVDQGVPLVGAVGHANTAAIINRDLDIPLLAHERILIALTPDDTLLVGQYTGPRLPEGATALPDGAKILYWVVYINAEDNNETP